MRVYIAPRRLRVCACADVGMEEVVVAAERGFVFRRKESLRDRGTPTGVNVLLHGVIGTHKRIHVGSASAVRGQAYGVAG